MPKALIVYSTRTGETKDIAELIAEGIRMQGAEAEVVNVTGIKKDSDLDGYDAYVFGIRHVPRRNDARHEDHALFGREGRPGGQVRGLVRGLWLER